MLHNILLLFLYISALLTLVLSSLSPDVYEVTNLKQYGSEDKMYAGYMPINLKNNDEGSFFFWLAAKRNNQVDTANINLGQEESLVIWLNGGPGCSSMVGMMWENGPFTIHGGESPGKYKLISNPYSWNEIANVLYVEQPIRAGYSAAAIDAPIIRTENDVSRDFHGFLTSFLEVFSQFKRSPVYITGESYAGAYIPSIASHIIRYQSARNINRINLQGVAIGNGVMDYMIQSPSYAEYAYNHGLIPLIAKQRIDHAWTTCLEKIQSTGESLTRGSFNHCNMMGLVLEAAGYPNQYNTNTFHDYTDISDPGGIFHQFFNDPNIQEILHVRGYNVPGINFIPENSLDIDRAPDDPNSYYTPQTWGVCNNVINSDMSSDHPTTMVPALQFLSTKIRVLLYSGEFDLNCNFLGTLHTLEANEWLGKRWTQAARSLWLYDDEIAGEYFSIGNTFAFLIVRNSGHLLPMDVPKQALDLLDRFISRKSFADRLLPVEVEINYESAISTTGTTTTVGGSPYHVFTASVGILLLLLLTLLISVKFGVLVFGKSRLLDNAVLSKYSYTSTISTTSVPFQAKVIYSALPSKALSLATVNTATSTTAAAAAMATTPYQYQSI